MNKLLLNTVTFASFAAASLVVIMIFVTAMTYSQLAFGALLYPIIIYLFFKAFPRNVRIIVSRKTAPNINVATAEKVVVPLRENLGITDMDKREFLKLIGATGISLVLYSVFSKRLLVPFYKKAMESQSGAAPASVSNVSSQGNPRPINEYRISEIDENITSYYGFVHSAGSWYIMQQDTVEGTFRYVRGDSDFSKNWAIRENLKYTYFDKAFQY